ncbi:MAG TPA: hypothetical protein VIJ84_06400, partial [Gaiellaceae bacterium]
PGMSGCPLWWHDKDTKKNSLYGIAAGSLGQVRPAQRETRIEQDGKTVVTETLRVEEYGVAVRIDAVLEWEIRQLGRCLFEAFASRVRREKP